MKHNQLKKKEEKRQTRTNFKTPNQRVWNATENSRSLLSPGPGWEGEDQCVGEREGGKCLLPQNTEPRGEPLMAERDMSTFRMGGAAAVWQQTRLPDDRALDLIWVVLIHFDTYWQTICAKIMTHINSPYWTVSTCFKKLHSRVERWEVYAP